jgi:probable HAF family extracellular repeat protein
LIPWGSGWDSLDMAHDINDAGQIVGSGKKGGKERAFLMTPVSREPGE